MATNVEEDDDLVVVLDDEDESDVATQGQPADDAGGDDPDSLVLIGDDDQDDDVNGNDDGSGGDHAQAQATQQQPPQDGQQQPPAVKPQPLQPQDDDLPEVLDLEPTTSAAATTTAASAADESENVLCCLSKKLIRRRRAMLLPCCHNMCSIKQWTEHVTKQSNDSSKVCPACSAYVPASLLLKHLPMSTCVEMAHAAVEMLQRHGRRHAVKALSLPRLQALLTTLAKTVKGRQVRKRRSYARSSQVTHKGRKTAWTKGVGFGGSSGTSVASRLSKAEKKQTAQDSKVAALLKSIQELLSQHTERGMVDFQALPPKSVVASVSGGTSSLCLQAILHSSCLSSVLASALRNDSVLDIAKRGELYSQVISIVETIARDPILLSAVLNPHDAFRHAYQAFLKSSEGETAKRKADASTNPEPKRAATSTRREDDDDDDDDEHDDDDDGEGMDDDEDDTLDSEAVCADFVALLKHTTRQVKIMTRADQSSAPDDADSHAVLHKFAPLLSLLREKMLALPPYMTQAPTSSSSTHTSTSGSTAAKTRQDQSQSASAEEKYVEELRPHAFRMVQMDYSSHLYKRYIDESANANVSRQRMSRILKEVASLTTSMPVHFASSICVRVDETRPDVIKAMITGPEDTPYANGCFIFDIFLPQQYPAVPPMVSLITTDGGRVRFGPNLYNTGKVCLSLLGTWSGPGWDPKVCTVLQVLVSIQSLILNEQPFFNEPGYEFSTQTPDSELYNTCVSYQTLRVAMLGYLRRINVDFNSAIRCHLSHKKKEIAQQLQKLVDAVKKYSSDQQGKKKGKKGNSFSAMRMHRIIHDLKLPTLPEACKLQTDLNAALDSLTVVDETVTLE